MGLKNLRAFEREFKFKFLSANIRDRKTDELIFKPFVTFDLPDKSGRLLVIGATQSFPVIKDTNTKIYKKAQEDVVIADASKAVNKIIANERKAGDIVIVLMFCEPVGLKKTLGRMGKVDLVVNGFHFLIEPQEYEVGVNKIISSGFRGRWFYDLVVSKKKKKAAHISYKKAIMIPSGLKRDKELSGLLDKYNEVIKKNVRR